MNPTPLFWTLLISAQLAVSPAAGEQWARFRGPNGSGISRDAKLPVTWTDDDYRWRIELPGSGHSSPVLWGRLLVVTCGEEQTGGRIVLGLDADSGRQLWRRQFASATHRKHKLNSYASATPALDERHVYTCWATPDEFIVRALDHAGRDVWHVDLGGFRAGHGDGVSPIVYQDLVVVPREHEGDSEIVALDAASGQVRWRVPRDSKSTWSTPCVLRREGRDELIFVTWTSGLTALDPRTGKVLWQADVFDKGHVESSIASPIVAGDLVLGTSGWLAVRQEVIAVRPRGDGGRVEPQRVYCLDRGAPLCVTPLAVDDLLFMWADEGIVTCADVRTGEVHWRQRVRGTFYASPIWAAGRLYNVSADGDVVVLAAAKQFQQLARIPLGQTSHSTPAVAGGVMYLRTLSQLMAVGG